MLIVLLGQVLVPASASAATVLFSDGFESGTTSAWSVTTQAGTGSTVSVTTGAAQAGQKGLETAKTGLNDNGRAEVSKSVSTPLSKVLSLKTRVRIVSRAGSGDLTLQRLFRGGPVFQSLAAIHHDGAGYALQLRHRDGSQTDLRLTNQLATGTWYDVELTYDWSGPQPVARAYINGQLDSTLTDSTAGTVYAPDAVYIGLHEGGWSQQARAQWDTVTVADTRQSAGSPATATPTSSPTASPAATATSPAASATPTRTATPVATATVPPTTPPTASPVPATPAATAVPTHAAHPLPATPAPTAVTTPTAVATAAPAQPVAGQPCPAALHDAQTTTGPDGKSWPTWHPPIDPSSGCLYGHEHGADPRTSKANSAMPAFGYAAAAAGMVEPHAGYKVFALNSGEVVESNVDNKTSDDDVRLVFHMGTGSVGRHLQPHHSFESDYIARDGSGREAHLTGLADTGATALNGSTCDTPRQGAKDFSTLHCEDAYEIWNSSKFQVMVAGEYTGINESRVGLLTSPAVFDPITTRDPTDNFGLIYTETVKAPGGHTTLSGIDPLSPNAWYQGCRREFYSGPLYFHNANGPTVYYTDAYGHVGPNGKDAEHSLRQYVSAVDSIKAAVFKSRTDYCGGGIHAPN